MFKIEADSETISIDGLKIAPAEGADLKEAISFAGGMREFPKLPSYMPFHQFVIKFFDDGTLRILRANSIDSGEIKFSFDTIDTLIIAITQAIDISVDKKKLDPSPRHSGGFVMHNSGDIIEGR